MVNFTDDLKVDFLFQEADALEEIKASIKEEYATEFLDELKGSDAVNYYYYSDSFKPTMIKKDPTNLYLNKIDTYFTPNTFKDGKRSEPAIVSLNAFYVDFDCGRDKDGNYFNIKTVNAFKEKVRDRLKHFPKHTALIETRNGYHVYWFIRAEDHHMSLDTWQKIETMIVNVLGSDPKVCDVTRLLRMPFSHASKNGIYHFDTFIYFMDKSIVWDATDLSNIIKLFYGGQAWLAQQESKQVSSVLVTGNQIQITSSMSNVAIMAVKSLDYNYFRSKWAHCAEGIPSKKFLDWVKQNINIREFMGLPSVGDFKCILHDDHNPSATVFAPSDKYKMYRYVCSSANCLSNKALTIIDLIATLANTKTGEAIAFLRNCFGYASHATTAPGNIIDVIANNNNILNELINESKAYKDKLTPVLGIYHTLADVAQETEKRSSITNVLSIIFSCSKRYLAKRSGEEGGNAYRKLQLLIALGLLKKSEPTESMKERDAKFNETKSAQYGRGVNYYSYVSIEKESIRQKLSIWIEFKGQIKKVSSKYLSMIFA
jgi:hypothetical protein